LNLEPWIDQ